MAIFTGEKYRQLSVAETIHFYTCQLILVYKVINIVEKNCRKGIAKTYFLKFSAYCTPSKYHNDTQPQSLSKLYALSQQLLRKSSQLANK